MKEIPLQTEGFVAIVDDDEYDRLSQHKWWATPGKYTTYAYTIQVVLDGKRVHVLMHRAVLRQPHAGVLVDHKDGDGLNNTRSNLRACTTSQNNAHKLFGVQGKKISRFKGVCWKKVACKWHAHIKMDGKYKHLGSFAVEEDAARAYDAAAVKRFGEFAVLNFKGEEDEQLAA